MREYFRRHDVQPLIDEIYQDIDRRSPWSYVKLQSLFEYVFVNYLKSKDILVMKPLKANISAAIKYANVAQEDCVNFFKLNMRANIIKHHNSEGIEFDSFFIQCVINQYNDFIKKAIPECLFLLLNKNNQELDDSYNKGLLSRSLADYIGNTSSRNIASWLIPCGVGKQDFGFVINCGFGKYILDEFRQSLYATIFNFLQRSRDAEKNVFLLEADDRNGYRSEFFYVYRYQMMILLLLKNGFLDKENVLSISAKETEEEKIRLAADNINHYASMLSSLCGDQVAYKDFHIVFTQDGVSFSDCDNSSCHYRDCETFVSDRMFWFAPNLAFHVDVQKHQMILTEFLSDFFGYVDFRQGQLEAIVSTLNSSSRTICIMPTGAGKSLVFYFNALLSPNPTIVISPTLALANDQQRNLFELHDIDDCFVFNRSVHKELSLINHFIYIVPEDLQWYDNIFKIKYYNIHGMLSNIILDEVHTLCSWSHDFRPDYLMLCHNLFTFVDRCRYIGFTATASYKVISDLMQQLKISDTEVIRPLHFNLDAFSFRFLKCKDADEQLKKLLFCIEEFVCTRNNEKDSMIVFTHSFAESQSIYDQLAKMDNHDTQCFDSESTQSYQEFLKGRKHILIADSDLGIGINLPNVVATIHYGLPNSKSQYVQEVGRASRDLSQGNSTVIFIESDSLSYEETQIIRFDTPIDEVIKIIKKNDTELSRLFRVMLGSSNSCEESAAHIVELYEEIGLGDYRAYRFKKHSKNAKMYLQKCIYKLLLLGVVDNWYIKDETDVSIDIEIEINSVEPNLNYVKGRVVSYLNDMRGYKFADEVEKASNIKGIIGIFEKWFYHEFMRYHREQLLNVIEFFNYYSENGKQNEIRDDLCQDFTVALGKIEDVKKYINDASQNELLAMSECITPQIVSSLEQLLDKEYDAKIDLAIFLDSFKKDKKGAVSRLLRVIDNASSVDRRILLENIYQYYANVSVSDRILILNRFEIYYAQDTIIDQIYRRVSKDEIYYGLLATQLNDSFGKGLQND